MTATRIGRLATLAAFSTVSLLHAQGNSAAARVRALNQQLIQLHAAMQRATSAEQATIRTQAAPVIVERLNALSELIAQNASDALSHSFSPELLADLASTFPGGRFESHGSWQGITECSVTSDPSMTQMVWRHNLKTAEGNLDVHFAGPEPEGLHSGHVLSVRGVRADNRVAAAGGSTGGDTTAATCSTVGAQNAIVILVNLPSYTLPAAVTQSYMKGVMLGNAAGGGQNTPDWSVDDFWRQNSDGQSWINTIAGPGELKVVGPYTLSSNYNANNTCDYYGMRDGAIAAVDNDPNAGVNFQNYSRVMLMVPANGACTWGGLGSLGCWTNPSPNDGNFTASVAWNRGDQITTRSNAVKLLTHEGGHNKLMHHASSRDFGAEVLGALNAPGTMSEYGDTHSTMGSWNLGFYNAPHAANQLGWIQQGTNYQVVETSGTYSIQPYETRPAGLKALKVRRGIGNDMWLWIEYRTNQGLYSSTLNSQIWSGALIHYYDSTTGTHSHLLDFTTGTAAFSDAALAAGQSWADPYSNVTITVNSATASALTVTVTYGTVPCTHANPTVTVTPSNPSVNAGTQYTYNVSVQNMDSAGCSSSAFALTSTQPTGWNPILSPTTLTVAPGATGSATLKVTPATSGFYSPAVTTSASANSMTGSGSANMTVTEPAPVPVVTLGALNATYPKRSTVPISATVTVNGSPVSGASVTFYLTRPNNQTTTKTLTTGSNGTATWNYKVNNTTGNYSVYAASTVNGLTGTSSSKAFTVQ